MKKNIAFCIPTYNRSQFITEFCEKFVAIYAAFGIDIYIYDSSENDETKEIVKRYQIENEFLYYIKVNTNIPSNEKIYLIYQGYMFRDEYKYIWMCGDTLRFSQKAIEKMFLIVDKQYDYIVMGAHEGKIYSDKNAFFVDCASFITFFGTVILNTDTVLRNVDWNYLSETYLSDDTLNYSQTGLYFEQLAKMDRFKAIGIPLAKDERYVSKLKMSSGWHSNAIDIICVNWVNTIQKLPECFDLNKREVTFKHGVTDIFSPHRMMQCKLYGVYNLKKYFKNFFRFQYVSDRSLLWLFFFAILPSRVAKKLYYSKDDIKNARTIQEIKIFAKGATKLFLYGAGIYGRIYASMLKRNDIEFEGFVETNGSSEEMIFCDKPVFEIGKLLSDKFDNDYRFIISVGKKYNNAIYSVLSSAIDTNRIFGNKLLVTPYERCNVEYFKWKKHIENGEKELDFT